MNRSKLIVWALAIASLTQLFVTDQLNAVNSRWWTMYYPDGTVEIGVADPRSLWVKYGLPNDMRGKRFYDLGCWDGGTCFEAAYRGSVDIFGLDSYVWEIDPCNYEHFCSARDRIAPFVKDAVVEIEPIPSKKWQPNSRVMLDKHSIQSFADKYGTADVVLAAGIVYHLIDPIKFLNDLKFLVKPNTGRVFITTWCSRDKAAVANFMPGWRGDDSNFWIFSVKCMLDVLNTLGYNVEKVHEVFPQGEPLMSFECTVPY